jgi:hypothetical protein
MPPMTWVTGPLRIFRVQQKATLGTTKPSDVKRLAQPR